MTKNVARENAVSEKLVFVVNMQNKLISVDWASETIYQAEMI